MKNLAGDPHCDGEIAIELQAAGITIARHEVDHPEVKSTLHGELAGWQFYRAWYYWTARPIDEDGGLPLELAIPLHETHGQEVRVAGHCGAPSPDEWTNTYDADGKHVILDPDGEQLGQFQSLQKSMPDLDYSKYRFVASMDEVENGRALVPSYHIDTLDGLITFAETIRKDN